MQEAQVRRSNARAVRNFLNAFSRLWNADRQRKGRALRDACRNVKGKTDYMLGKKGDFSKTFFCRLARRLGQKAIRERQNLDIVYYETEARNISHEKRIRPARLSVIIEHETGKEVEEEMWKMLMWRAPLKVLVFYDWSDNERKNKPEKAQWLRNKLDDLFKMGCQVDNLWPEADKTVYLFLVGQSPKRGDLPVWGYLCVQGGCWPEQPDELQPLPTG